MNDSSNLEGNNEADAQETEAASPVAEPASAAQELANDVNTEELDVRQNEKQRAPATDVKPFHPFANVFPSPEDDRAAEAGISDDRTTENATPSASEAASNEGCAADADVSKQEAVKADAKAAIQIADQAGVLAESGKTTDAKVSAGAPLLNGDEHDVRMAEIAAVFDHAAMPHLDRAGLVAEWARHAEAKLQHTAQVVQNTRGGRPKGVIGWAAEELKVPRASLGAKREYIRRALKIDTIWPEAKAAVRAVRPRLDSNQSALLAIADERSPEAQLAKVQELAARKAEGRRNRQKLGQTAVIGDAGQVLPDALGASELLASVNEVLTVEERAQFEQLETAWGEDGVLWRADWDNAAANVRRQFISGFLLTTPAPSHSQEIVARPTADTPDTPRGDKDKFATERSSDEHNIIAEVQSARGNEEVAR
jgi:hypothetical protein